MQRDIPPTFERASQAGSRASVRPSKSVQSNRISDAELSTSFRQQRDKSFVRGAKHRKALSLSGDGEPDLAGPMHERTASAHGAMNSRLAIARPDRPTDRSKPCMVALSPLSRICKRPGQVQLARRVVRLLIQWRRWLIIRRSAVSGSRESNECSSAPSPAVLAAD